MTTAETELFNAAQYEIPFPETDGHRVTDLVIRIPSFTLNLNRNDPDHAALVESLTLGRYGRAQAIYAVEGKTTTLKTDDAGTEQVTHVAVVRITDLDFTEA